MEEVESNNHNATGAPEEALATTGTTERTYGPRLLQVHALALVVRFGLLFYFRAVARLDRTLYTIR